ncbi:MAG: nicotinamidase [Elusimicrobia bacterium]|nr:nicotinamidase [Elusimicrobiota bacterium]
MAAPPFHDPRRLGTIFLPDAAAIAAAAAEAGLPPAARDRRTLHPVIVDMQVDFCHPNGALFVPGALADLSRIIEFIYAQAGRITRITASLDAHLPHQIFTPSWWLDAGGRPPAPFTIITAREARAGRWRPAREPEWSLAYVERLEFLAKKPLTIWPYHAQIGSPGGALDPSLWSAILWHSLARGAQPDFLAKGSLPKTEHYSILQPEAPPPESAGAGRAEGLIEALRRSDSVLIAGEAASHCVLETLEDLAKIFAGEPRRLSRIAVLRDCTSPVAHPETDFAALTRERFRELERRGVRFLDSTGPGPF